MLPILQIGGLAIQLPGLLSLAGIWFGLSAIDRQAARLKLPVATIQNMLLLGLLSGVIGARLGYVARYLEVYLGDPKAILALQPATLSPEAGLITGLLASWIYGQRRRLPFWRTADALAPGLAVFSLFLGLSHLASGNAFGALTSLPWGIDLWGARRHPSQVYEILAAGLVLVVVLRAGRSSPHAGFTFSLWVILASSSRLVLEGFRGDSLVLASGVRSAQWVALLTLLAAITLARHLAVASPQGATPVQGTDDHVRTGGG